MNSKKDLNEKYLSFLEQTKGEKPKTVQHLNDRVLIVDGLNTFIRSFAVNPALNEDGLHVGGMMGFLKSVRYTSDILKPSRVIIVFDGKNGSGRRQKIYPEYKGTRKVKRRLNRNVDWGTAPQDEQQSMKQQMGRLIEYLEQLPLTLICVDGIEADDTMAYISQQLLPKSDIMLMSTDKDFLQLVDDRVKVWSPTKKKLYTKQVIQEEFGLPSRNMLTYRILDGDKSDNINGVMGAGLKSLIKRNYLLMQLNNVDIPNHTKMKIQGAVNGDVPQLIKYKFQTMFLKDKLQTGIKNFDSWVMEFTRLDRFRGLSDR